MAAFGPTPRAIDEVQRAGDGLVRAIKRLVDDDRTPGQFLLNGSADFLTVPTISESLAGRATLLQLWPFTQGEMAGEPDGMLEVAFDDHRRLLGGDASPYETRDYFERLCAGGFPEPTTLPGPDRGRWFRSYVQTVTERDVTELTGARRAGELPRLLRLLAASTASELVVARIHDQSQLGRDATRDYVSYLEMTYLIVRIPAWSRNLTRKIARHPKVHVSDSGLAAHLLGKNADALARPTDPARGALLETFAVNELLRQATWLDRDVTIHHLRDRDGAEVDVVAEASDGAVVAIEVKTSTAVSPADAKWLAWLRDKIRDDFVCGLVLYAGDRPFSLGDRLLALPLSYLWTAG